MSRSVATALTVVLCGHASTLAAPDAYRDLVAAKDPILWYRMGEPAGSATVANDGTLGASHDATIFGGVTLGEPGASGDTAASFAYSETPYLESAADAPASMLGNPDFTAEVVVYIPSDAATSSWPPFLHWGTGLTAHEVYFSLEQNQRDRVFCGFYNGGMMGVCTLRLDDWNHIVWVRDSNGAANDAYTGSRLFVNGVEESLTRSTHLPNFGYPPDVAAGPFRVQRAVDFYRHFDGVIDEVVLYDTLLTPAQIGAHFDALGLTRPCAADLDGNCGVLDLTDVTIFVSGFLSLDPIADLNGDGLWDLTDVQLFVVSFLAGC
ncbi:MAG: LamG domain-containing protein [Phycisphaeraceae bacterium]|nr:MAG: LamG domain-containing protein [Phycisphaeraceae bacterium]